MKDVVKPEDVVKLYGIYDLFERKRIALKSSLPDEIKGIADIDMSVLNIVSSNPDIIVREIAQILNVPNSTLTSSLNRLEDKGFANRTINKRDRRSFGIELTEKGMAIHSMYFEYERVFFEDLLGKINTHEERALLLEILKKCVS
jgi:DNA-binding MarR family transcriptional regulator